MFLFIGGNVEKNKNARRWEKFPPNPVATAVTVAMSLFPLVRCCVLAMSCWFLWTWLRGCEIQLFHVIRNPLDWSVA